MELLGGEQRKAITEVEAELIAEERTRARPGAIRTIDPIGEHVSQKLQILAHGKLLADSRGLRRDQFELGEVTAVTPRVPGVQRRSQIHGLRADEEIRQDVEFGATRLAVSSIGLARKEQRAPRH